MGLRLRLRARRSTDGGETYTSLASANGYTTPAASNPNANALPGAVRQRPHRHERLVRGGHRRPSTGVAAAATRTAAFVDDEYDLTALRGQGTAVLRFSTPPTRASPGPAGSSTTSRSRPATARCIYSSRLRDDGDRRPARLQRRLQGATSATRRRCTDGLAVRRRAAEGSPADHAYYLEMRDRSGFDLDGKRRERPRRRSASSRAAARLHRRGARLRQRRRADRRRRRRRRSTRSRSRATTTPNLDDAAFTAAAGRNVVLRLAGDRRLGRQLRRRTTHAPTATGTSTSTAWLRRARDDAATTSGRTSPPGNLTGDVRSPSAPAAAPFDYGSRRRGERARRPPSPRRKPDDGDRRRAGPLRRQRVVRRPRAPSELDLRSGTSTATAPRRDRQLGAARVHARRARTRRRCASPTPAASAERRRGDHRPLGRAARGRGRRAAAAAPRPRHRRSARSAPSPGLWTCARRPAPGLQQQDPESGGPARGGGAADERGHRAELWRVPGGGEVGGDDLDLCRLRRRDRDRRRRRRPGRRRRSPRRGSPRRPGRRSPRPSKAEAAGRHA